MSAQNLPEPWDYAYEWDGPFGTRKLSAAQYNGRKPDRSVPLYTADQMREMWRQGLEDAAKEAENWRDGEDAADAIRRLKDTL